MAKKHLLILVRGNTYNFKSFQSSQLVIPNANQLLIFKTGTTWTQGAYTNEYTGGVTGSRAYYGGTASTLTFKVPSNAPDNLYYHCGNHNNMGGSFVVVDNPVTTLDTATETNYKNEWNIDGSKKLSQRLVQEHTVSNRNLSTPIVLEVIPSSILDMEVFKNGNRLVFGTDFTLSDSLVFDVTPP